MKTLEMKHTGCEEKSPAYLDGYYQGVNMAIEYKGPPADPSGGPDFNAGYHRGYWDIRNRANPPIWAAADARDLLAALKFTKELLTSIATAKSRGFGIDYAIGCVESINDHIDAAVSKVTGENKANENTSKIRQ